MDAAQDLADLRLDRLQLRVPGYPLLLVLTGSAEAPTRALFWVSLLIHFASVWMLASVLHLVGVSRPLLILFGVLLLLPPFVEPAAEVLTENLSQLTLVVAVAGIVFWLRSRRTGWLVAASLAAAGATLVRPTYYVLSFALAACLIALAAAWKGNGLGFRDAARASLVLIAGSVLIVGGYCLMNYARFRYFGLSPFFGITLTTKTVRFLERLPDSHAVVREELIRARDASLVKRGSSHSGTQYIFGVFPRLLKLTGLSVGDLDRYLLRMNLILIRSAPMNYVHSVASDVGGYWLPASGQLASFNSRGLQLFWSLIHFAIFGAVALQFIAVAGVHLVGLTRRRRGVSRPLDTAVQPATTPLEAAAYWLAATVIAYTMVVSCAVNVGGARYRVPTDGLILLFACLGFHIWARWAKDPGAGAAELSTTRWSTTSELPHEAGPTRRKFAGELQFRSERRADRSAARG